MTWQETVDKLGDNAEQLEQLYRTAVRAGKGDAFREAIETRHAAAPDNLLYAAWYYRLRAAATQGKEAFIAWGWAIPLALLNGLALWLLSDEERFGVIIAGAPSQTFIYNYIPVVVLLAGLISAALVMAYLAGAGRKRWWAAALISLVLAAAGAWVLWAYPQLGPRPYQEQYLTLMAAHLPLLAWAGVGLFLGVRDATDRFAFLNKSLELFIMAGLFAVAGGIFIGITAGLFEALGIALPSIVMRLLIAGGMGLLPVMATAVIYNPRLSPAGQEFDEGLSRLVALLTRVLLPLTALVLLVYIAFIPFNLRAPFENREVLITYNAMLFAIVALLTGATPVNLERMSPRAGKLLRWGIILLAAAAVAIGVYALAAIVYRTAMDRPTPNRLTFIGWNVVNIGLLLAVLYRQARPGRGGWAVGLHRAFATGAAAYTLWALVVIVALPWLFGINQAQVDNLPPAVQNIIYNQPAPILLKCNTGPHIYLLEGGQKRWIDTIATFTARGYVWSDVEIISCGDLEAIPEGASIPEGAVRPAGP